MCFSQDPKPIIVDRLFRGTLAVAYRQKNVTYQGPFPSEYRVKTSDSTLILYLDHGKGHIDKKIDSGFEVRDTLWFCNEMYVQHYIFDCSMWGRYLNFSEVYFSDIKYVKQLIHTVLVKDSSLPFNFELMSNLHCVDIHADCYFCTFQNTCISLYFICCSTTFHNMAA